MRPFRMWHEPVALRTETPTPRRALLICGLVRSADHFAAYLDGVDRLAVADLRIILSTWTGELDRYPEIRARLVRMGAILVEQDQPDLKLPGHMLHQALTLELGLSLLDDDVFVLKTRPDICGVMDVVHFMRLAPDRLVASRLATPFTHRVHVVGMFGAHPAYINDIIFAGMAGDLRRLSYLPMVYGAKYPRLSPEQWLWSTVLAPGNAVLDAYLAVNPGLIFNDPARHAAACDVLAAAPLFAHAIAASAVLTHDTLAYLHPDPTRAATAEACGAQTLEALLWDDLRIPGIDHHPLAAANTFVSAGVMDAIHAGRIRASVLGDGVALAIAEAGSGVADRRALAREAGELADALQKKAQIGGAQTAHDGQNSRLVMRGPPAWQVAASGDVAVELDQEITRMRRTIDQLTARLAGRGS